VTRRFAIHPLLIAAFPVLALWSGNLSEVGLGDVWRPLLVVVGITGAVYGLLALVLRRDHRRAAIVTSGLVAYALLYGHVWNLVNRAIAEQWILLVIWTLLGAVVVWLVLRTRYLPETTSILNGLGIILVVVALVPVVNHSFTGQGRADPPDKGDPEVGEVSDRDLYYIILDRYGSERSLKALFDYDNSPFMEDLEDRGFTVAYDSLANYPKTAHSLAASMNLEYLDDLATPANHASSNWGPVYNLLRDHRLGRVLTNAGVQYVHVGTWWSPTETAASADVTYKYGSSTEFSKVLYYTTIIPGFRAALGLGGDRDTRLLKRNSTLYQFDTLERLARQDPKRPRFVFAHITLPHEPYVFAADGSLVTQDMEDDRTRALNYTNQVKYANARMRDLFDILLDRPEAERPIVVLQADEGPHPVRYEHLERRYEWDEATLAELQEKLRILNAYYLPGSTVIPRRDITPVNTFRMILDEYYGTNLGQLPDEVFIFLDGYHLYDFVEVTDHVDGDEMLPDPYEGRWRRGGGPREGEP
jgi:sulfatase-like protein